MLGLNSDYQYQFETQDGIFFKNGLTDHLDSKYGDIRSKIVDLE